MNRLNASKIGLWLFVGAIALLALFVFRTGQSGITALSIVLIAVALLTISYRFPDVAILLLILTLTNIFGIFNILEDWRIPGIGKPCDFILVSMNIAVLARIVTRSVKLSKIERRFSLMVFVLLAYFVFLIVYSSKIRAFESINDALRVGGPYMYYSSFLFPIFLATKRRHFVRFVNFLRLGGFVTGVIAIASNIVGYSIVSGVVSHEAQGYIRVYLPYFFNMFVLGLWTVQKLSGYRKEFKIGMVELLINVLGIVLFLGRGLIIAAMLMIFTYLVITPTSFGKVARYSSFAALAVLGIVLSFSITGFSLGGIWERFAEGFMETLQGTGNFSSRLYAQQYGFQLFAQSPLFGTGFIYKTSPYYQVLFTPGGLAATNSADFGLGSILFTTGAIGFCLIAYLVFSLVIHIRRVLSTIHDTAGMNLEYVYSMTLIGLIPILFVVVQLVGNEFGGRGVAVDMIALAYGLKALGSIAGKQKLRRTGS